MKKIYLIIMLIFAITISTAQETEGQKLSVIINNISNNNGHVLLSLHTEDTFMRGTGIQTAKTEVIDGKVEATFNNVSQGTYAIMALHDANDSYSMDFDDSGRPIESYGMTNNPTLYGPPVFGDAKFEVENEDLSFEIKLN